MPRSAAQIRREAMLEAIGWLEYRAAVCLKTEREWAADHGETSRGAATERAARMELELAIREIAAIAGLPARSKLLRANAEKRRAFIAENGPAKPWALTRDEQRHLMTALRASTKHVADILDATP
jgi:hypothetical protein